MTVGSMWTLGQGRLPDLGKERKQQVEAEGGTAELSLPGSGIRLTMHHPIRCLSQKNTEIFLNGDYVLFWLIYICWKKSLSKVLQEDFWIVSFLSCCILEYILLPLYTLVEYKSFGTQLIFLGI